MEDGCYSGEYWLSVSSCEAKKGTSKILLEGYYNLCFQSLLLKLHMKFIE